MICHSCSYLCDFLLYLSDSFNTFNFFDIFIIVSKNSKKDKKVRYKNVQPYFTWRDLKVKPHRIDILLYFKAQSQTLSIHESFEPRLIFSVWWYVPLPAHCTSTQAASHLYKLGPKTFSFLTLIEMILSIVIWPYNLIFGSKANTVSLNLS